MKYRLECLTPTLVGDGSALSPIDYMVWKNQVNVLDQRRIFRLLAKGPRLEGYLSQIKRADRLDFASWGGFAQNYAGRRIPFEHSSCATYWERLRAEDLHIPTFVCGNDGPYMPASALKGALRTAYLSGRGATKMLEAMAPMFQGERPPRRPGEQAEQQLCGRSGNDPLKPFSFSDSAQAPVTATQIYMLRTAALVGRGGAPGSYSLGWKSLPRGTVEGHRVEDGAAEFAEMAIPGNAFEGSWSEKQFYRHPDVVKALRWREPLSLAALMESANAFAELLLDAHRQFAVSAGLEQLEALIEALAGRLKEIRPRGDCCLLSIGWGASILGKAAWALSSPEAFRELLSDHPIYGRVLKTGFPFPKTRRVVFLENQPASMPGWVQLLVQSA